MSPAPAHTPRCTTRSRDGGVAAADADLRIGVSEIRHHPGDRLRVERDVDLEGIAVTTAAVAVGSSAHLDVVVESLSDGVTVTGTLEVPWVGPCRRCLEETGGVAEVRLREVFSERPVDDEMLPLDGDVVDLAPVVHDAAILALPLAPLCGPDCAGPAPAVFPVVTATDGDLPLDPRWSALDELRFDPDPDDPLQ